MKYLTRLALFQLTSPFSALKIGFGILKRICDTHEYVPYTPCQKCHESSMSFRLKEGL